MLTQDHTTPLLFEFGIMDAKFQLTGSSKQSVNTIVIILNNPLAGSSHRETTKMKATRTRRLGGFTLTEIMIVIGIISLLAAIVIPNLLKAGAKSQATTCINNMRQLDTAIQQFSVEAGKHVGDVVNYPNDLTPYIKLNHQGQIPPCPTGGIYSLNTVGNQPSVFCSLGTSVSPPHIQN
jgi:prepilin-type N-terminal cleavage/methylation domain-containing protein